MLSAEFMAAVNVAFGYAERRGARLKKRGLKLAHYTSADVAAQILLKKNVWMRNASSMNDYLEVAFGSTCLKAALSRHRDRFEAALNVARPGLCKEILEWLDRADFNHHQHTYLTSLSEHKPTDELGQLSMWRAYGGPIAGVALVFNPDFLDMDSNELATWSSPVLYGDEAFIIEFEALTKRLEDNAAALTAIEPDTLRNLMFNALQFLILSAKHVGFREEREWRIIHGPREYSSAWVQPSFESVRGKPEIVYHLPLQNEDGMNLPEIDLKQLLHRVIIGPCQNPYQVASTFQEILHSLNFEMPEDCIRVSLIPLRQQG